MMQQEIAPPSKTSGEYRMEVIGEYEQPMPEVLLDKEQRACFVEAGLYPVVGARSRTSGEIREGGVIFDAVDRTTGEARTVVQFHSPRELRELAQSGQLKLETGIDRSLFADKVLKQHPQAEKPRLGMRR